MVRAGWKDKRQELLPNGETSPVVAIAPKCAGGGPADPVCVVAFNPPPFIICCPVARGTAQFTVTELPEQSPLSYLLVGAGLGLLGVFARRFIHLGQP
jgi:hypothetical protein